jgi:hypothetical protein
MDFHLPFLGECSVHLPFAYYLTLCPLSNLLLNPCCASKIGTHVHVQIYLQTCLKVMVKFIINFLDNCQSPSALSFVLVCFLIILIIFLSTTTPKSNILLAHLSFFFLFFFPFLISSTFDLFIMFSLNYLSI